MTELRDTTDSEQQAAESEPACFRLPRWDVENVPPSRKGDFDGVERRSETFKNVFVEDDSQFRSIVPRVTHWSVAWSDLMMTMFILFLSMFVYQAAHKEFLVSDEVEILGGDSTEAIEIAHESRGAYPFAPIKPGAPLVTAGTVKKIERLHLQNVDPETPFFEAERRGDLARIEQSLEPPVLFMDEKKRAISTDDQPEGIVPGGPEEGGIQGDIIQPRPLLVEGLGATTSNSSMEDVFSLSQEALDRFNLNAFASIDLVPNTSMRIVLTADMLFDTGEAELRSKAKDSLEKIGSTIQQTPYMINVVGHTDNVPMSSARFPSNWELSVAQASSVGRFLIEELEMSPQQFLISGFASYRPMLPNTNMANRAVNRRVEIIISKRLPRPVDTGPENLK